MSRIPPYLFAEIDKKVAAKRAAGVDVIALDIGDPDTPTPEHIVRAAAEALHARREPPLRVLLRDAGAARGDRGLVPAALRRRARPRTPRSCPRWAPRTASRTCRSPWSNPGDVVLVPEPRLPGLPDRHGDGRRRPLPPAADRRQPLAARPRRHPRRRGRARPDPVAQLPQQPHRRHRATRSSSRRRWTSAAATASCSATTSPTRRSPSAATGRRASCSFPGAKEVAVEFHSLSKTFNMTGWRVGMAVGNAEVLRLLGPGQDQHRLRHLPGGPARRPSPRSMGLRSPA